MACFQLKLTISLEEAPKNPGTGNTDESAVNLQILEDVAMASGLPMVSQKDAIVLGGTSRNLMRVTSLHRYVAQHSSITANFSEWTFSDYTLKHTH